MVPTVLTMSKRGRRFDAWTVSGNTVRGEKMPLTASSAGKARRMKRIRPIIVACVVDVNRQGDRAAQVDIDLGRRTDLAEIGTKLGKDIDIAFARQEVARQDDECIPAQKFAVVPDKGDIAGIIAQADHRQVIANLHVGFSGKKPSGGCHEQAVVRNEFLRDQRAAKFAPAQHFPQRIGVGIGLGLKLLRQHVIDPTGERLGTGAAEEPKKNNVTATRQPRMIRPPFTLWRRRCREVGTETRSPAPASGNASRGAPTAPRS